MPLLLLYLNCHLKKKISFLLEELSDVTVNNPSPVAEDRGQDQCMEDCERNMMWMNGTDCAAYCASFPVAEDSDEEEEEESVGPGTDNCC